MPGWEAGMARARVEASRVMRHAGSPIARRRGLRLAAVGVFTAWAGTGALLFTVGSSPVGATEQPTLKATPNGPDATQTYAPIAAQNPVFPTAVGDPTPDECSAPAGYCDVVPIEINTPPDFNTDSYYLSSKVAVAWQSQRVDNPAQPVQQDDVDIYLYLPDKDKDGNWVEPGHSASSSNPEVVTTEQTKFLLLVNNFSGANTGYTVTIHSTIEKIEK